MTDVSGPLRHRARQEELNSRARSRKIDRVFKGCVSVHGGNTVCSVLSSSGGRSHTGALGPVGPTLRLLRGTTDDRASVLIPGAHPTFTDTCTFLNSTLLCLSMIVLTSLLLSV